ncbi:phage antirepressor KilAC domain-containing protein [Pseudomonas sp. DCB_CB]|uniref:phage antirepressor KilAC domain-containing protein n=1 Tax=unclassified Pseudomonas TaxID=196821 RepID=UPI00224946C9|nr:MULTISPECIES: phage antirepressor KilAC domain-containing protein [unclassified Pseudomonas]MCX2689588.1 phage antirepressor KilAC domain-containing protein [Pseudomonas sp. DCB_BZ]MCX2854675.1 phage antirepressor KilAC domain-containing protein [Pseudomonas sp. DCB_CB]
MERTLAQTAQHFGISRNELIRRMRENELLTERNLPRYPTRDREYLRIKEGSWFHPGAGMQYSESTRVKQAGIPWLAERLNLQLPTPPEDKRHAA